MRTKKIVKIILYLVLVLAFVFASGYFLLSKMKKNKDKSVDSYFTVKRGDLPIGVFLSGTINAKKKHKLSLEANIKTTLTWIVPETSSVKAGDIVAKFETDDLDQKIEELELSLQNLLKEKEIALEEIRIQKSVNEAQIKIAKDNLSEAQEAFLKYRKLEGPKQQDTQTVKVEEAEKLLEEAKKNYEDALATFKETVFMSEDEKKKELDKLNSLEKKVQTEQINYNNAILDRKILERFTYPNTLSQLLNKVEQEKLNLEKTIVTANSQLLQKENQLAKIEAQIKKVQYDLEKHKSYRPMMELVSPVDGVVIYSDPDRRWGPQEIKVGMEIRPRDIIVTIPEMSALVADFDLPEQYRAKVKVGDKVIIQPDSIPGLKIEGILSSIAPTPINQILWDRNSPKIFPSKIEFNENHNKLVSGMSVKVEIITDILKDILFIPIEAVFDEGGKFFVYLKTDSSPEVREIKIGSSNEFYVEIKNGLKEGDVVCLFRPYQN